MAKKPLNGEKTHPLTRASKDALRQLMASEFPAQEFNPGVKNRLLREDLVEAIMLPSPYAIHIGKRVNIAYLRITPAGRAALAQALEGGAS